MGSLAEKGKTGRSRQGAHGRPSKGELTLRIPDIYERLGLQDPDEFERERRNARLTSIMFVHNEHIEEMLRRGTGRTTRMLVAAMRDISAGKHVFVAGSNFEITRRIELTAREYIRVLGLNQDKLHCSAWMQLDYFGHFYRNETVYLDHVIWENPNAIRVIQAVEGRADARTAATEDRPGGDAPRRDASIRSDIHLRTPGTPYLPRIRP